MNSIEYKFSIEVEGKTIEKNLFRIKEISKFNEKDIEILKKCFCLIDLTSLNSTDGYGNVMQLAEIVNAFPQQFPDLKNVAAICVYPTLIGAVKENLSVNNVRVVSVAAGFPSSQTFIDVKLSECKAAIEAGAQELDVVISIGSLLEGDYFTVFSELQMIKEVASDAQLKVILETGALPTLQGVKLASFLAMEAGADFIKTSTGSLLPAATPEAVYVMCEAIKEFYQITGKKVGIKPAGGIAKVTDAALYYTIVEQVLGEDWLNPEWFRLGASRLANNLLSDITGKETLYF